jgi:hypothetical protein
MLSWNSVIVPGAMIITPQRMRLAYSSLMNQGCPLRRRSFVILVFYIQA